MATKKIMKKRKQLLMDIVEEFGRPMQRHEILEKIIDLEEGITDNALGVTLTNCKSFGFLHALKYSGLPTFYAHPNWVTSLGSFKPGYQFNHITKDFKTPINATENNPT